MARAVSRMFGNNMTAQQLVLSQFHAQRKAHHESALCHSCLLPWSWVRYRRSSGMSNWCCRRRRCRTHRWPPRCYRCRGWVCGRSSPRGRAQARRSNKSDEMNPFALGRREPNHSRVTEMPMITTRTGGRACGAVRNALKGEPFRFGECYCTSCRKESGSVFVGYAQWRIEDSAEFSN